MSSEIGAYDAKTKLPELLREVQNGKRFTITHRGKPVADLVPRPPPRDGITPRQSGTCSISSGSRASIPRNWPGGLEKAADSARS
ncbi:MAG: type II toxin-antitoxin system prevent-host-death family antitoxin [Alphaproteobacteria bacterium]|nr:type II toxin-antitoxin system prevent-host-death family antitoxin [Alphaproteobacteria bacterium]MBV9150953.1 type II toxin-antitoxin system prevent-host-death family antitoxin [Alphaproteobacteria bacterium]MBV9584127.1 type II toxin-antitoxin system prevent-host-death family antitoxin [Alphaproteobacteria bacterium]MBV9966907.1 type II toxin-antitoxin system prevent-host-death family antitoxin [Alphaproteobacteria bacterium]